MLRSRLTRILNTSPERCLECLGKPDEFLSYSKYTYAVRRADSEYEVVFRWVKWGMTRFYKVRFKVVRQGREVRYESTPDSEYWFQLVFRIRERGGGRIALDVEASMKAGLMVNLLGRKDYAAFVEELVDKGIGGMLDKERRKIIAATERLGGERAPSDKASCTGCLLYDSANSYCYYLAQKVEDPDNPPCGGKHYIKPL